MESLWAIMGSDDDAERMMIAIANNWLDGVREQLAKGVTGNTVGESVARGPGAVTMFSFACERGNLEAARLLYAPDIDLEARDSLGRTPLMDACSALHDALPEIEEIEPLTLDEIERRESLVRWLVEIGADANAFNPPHDTVLHHACSGCSEAMVELLIEKGAQVDWPEDDPHTAFMLAARRGNLGARA